jgi:hypothetical protein
MDAPPKVRRPGLWLAAIGLAASGLAVWLFPRAMPTLALHQQLTRQAALQRADSFFQSHDLAPVGARHAVRFESNDSLQTYVDLAGGGRDTLKALLAGHDVALFTWSVRAFVPHDPHEARVDFATDGQVIGFRRVLAESDVRPELSQDSARALAGHVLADWIGRDTTRWRLASTSYETRKTSGRVDRTFTFERKDRRIADALIRMKVVIAGDTPSMAHPYVVIPQSFQRRYGEMRSFNDLLAVVAQVGMLLLLIGGAFVLRRFALARRIRWRPALLVGGVVGLLFVAAGLNEIPGSWFGYDTATSPTTFLVMLVLQSILSGVGITLLVGLTLAAAEAAARRAFPDHLDWWKLWKHRGTRAVAGRVAGGYVVAAVGFAYVALFYLVTRKLLGWWVPTELIDDPNLISTPFPWLSGVAVSLQAGIWEESLFRALPLSLLAIWVGNRPHRMRWLAGGVVVTAVVFGFAHSNYTSWPPYSRGAEIFLEACFWAVLFLVFGLLVTVLAHFSYDLLLFGSFAASGSASAYHVTAGVILLVLFAPALAVGWRWVRQRGLGDLPEDARFRAWRAPPRELETDVAAPPATRVLSPRARNLALAVGAAAVLLAVLLPSPPTLGPSFTVRRARAVTVADSMIGTRGVNPSAWTTLAAPFSGADTEVRRFLVAEHVTALAPKLAALYAPPAWWEVRYVHTGGTPADRAEEWRVRLRPDGAPLDVHHVLPDSAARDSVSNAEARRIARATLAHVGFDTLALQESDLEQTARPARRDVTVTYTDTLLRLPAGAEARASVTVAGEEPLAVRRSVDLPEKFKRAERERDDTHQIILVVCGVLFVVMLTVAGLSLVRGRSPVLDDGRLNRRATLIALGGLALLGIAGGLNGLPRVLAQYDTAVPWTNFVGMNIVGMLVVAVEAVVAYGFWLALDTLRRRVGVRLFPEPTPRGRRDLLLAGLGIGAVATLAELLRPLVPAGVPAAPTTLLGSAFPALSPALSIPLDVVMAAAGLGIPLLVIAGVSKRASVRALVAALLFLPMLGIFLALAPEGANLWARGAVFTAGTFASVWLWLRYWAPLCAWSWIMAGLVASGVEALRRTVHAPTPIEHVAGAVALAATLGLVALAVRVAGPLSASAGRRDPPAPPSAPH